jgi:hypothetical protein
LLPLAEVQQRFTSAVLLGEAPDLAFKGRVPADAAFAVHRNTVIGGLVNALRLSFPTVDALVGERFFDTAGQQFAISHPPRHPGLDEFGQQFIDFLHGLPAAACLPYLADVARLDWAIGHALRRPAMQRAFALDARVSLLLPQSLSVLRLAYPAHAIRAAIGDDEALASLDMAPAEYRILVWRKGDTAAVQPIRTEAGNFLHALIGGADVQAAMRDAGTDATNVSDAIQQHVFTASFCRLEIHSEKTP